MPSGLHARTAPRRWGALPQTPAAPRPRAKGWPWGGGGYPFEGEFELRGCYMWGEGASNELEGRVFFGTGGNAWEMTKDPTAGSLLPRVRLEACGIDGFGTVAMAGQCSFKPCGPDQFQCARAGQCIESEAVCNGAVSVARITLAPCLCSWPMIQSRAGSKLISLLPHPFCCHNPIHIILSQAPQNVVMRMAPTRTLILPAVLLLSIFQITTTMMTTAATTARLRLKATNLMPTTGWTPGRARAMP